MAFACVVWLAVASGLLSGCAHSPANQDAETKRLARREVVFGMGWEPISFYPLRALDSASYYAQTLVYEGLVKYDSRLEIVPGLANSMEVSPDGLNYRFRLRDNLHFGSGEPIAPADVIASIKLAASPSSPYYSDYKDIESVRATPDALIEIQLARPCAPLLSRMVELRILPERLLALPDHGRLSLSRRPLASGPYTLASWESACELVFVPNPYYWGRKPHLERLIWRVIPDPNLLGLSLLEGEVDVAQVDARPWSMLALRNKGKLSLARFPGSRTVYLGLNGRKEPFDDMKVRQALCLAIDRQALVRDLYKGYADLADTDFLRKSWAYNPQAGHIPYDPAQAAKKLVQAGFKRVGRGWLRDGLPLAFSIITVRDYQDQAQVVSADIRRLGIIAPVEIVEFATLRQQYLKQGNFQAVVWSRSVGPDPECFLSWHSTGPLNFCAFHSDRLDQLIECGRLATNKKQREPCYEEIQAILATELPWVFLVHPDLLVAHDGRVVNVMAKGQNESGLPWDNPLFNACDWDVRLP